MNADVKQKLHDLLTGIEGPTQQRAAAFLLAHFDAHANSFPGPDKTVKATLRPHVASWIDSLIKDYCTGI